VFAAAPPQLCFTAIEPVLRPSLEQAPGLIENLGCPAQALVNVPAASQIYDNGRMIWVDLGAGGKKIYSIYNSPVAPGRPLTFQVNDDTWTTAEPGEYGLTPPAGHVAPVRGFGKLWVSNKFVREALGWPLAAEQGGSAVVQQFSSGATVLWMPGDSTVYVLDQRPGNTRALAFR